MPKYELLYIVGSETADDAVPQVTDEIKKSIETAGGTVEKFEDWGRRKLAYPIKKTRNGYYVLINFDMPADKVSEIEHKMRVNQSVIRHLIANMDEAIERMEKDRIIQAQMKPRRLPAEGKPVEEKAKPAAVRRTLDRDRGEGGKIEIDLDAEIEKAIGADNN